MNSDWWDVGLGYYGRGKVSITLFHPFQFLEQGPGWQIATVSVLALEPYTKVSDARMVKRPRRNFNEGEGDWPSGPLVPRLVYYRQSNTTWSGTLLRKPLTFKTRCSPRVYTCNIVIWAPKEDSDPIMERHERDDLKVSNSETFSVLVFLTVWVLILQVCGSVPPFFFFFSVH